MLTIGILGATTFVIYLDGRASNNYLAAARAQDTQLHLAALETAMNDAKAGLQGFLATDDLRFLEPEVGVVDIRVVLEQFGPTSNDWPQPSLPGGIGPTTRNYGSDWGLSWSSQRQPSMDRLSSTRLSSLAQSCMPTSSATPRTH